MRLGSSWIRALGFIILEETCDFEFVAPLSSGCKTLAKVGDRAIDANASHENWCYHCLAQDIWDVLVNTNPRGQRAAGWQLS